jgi:Cysteine-rich secretory protein family
MYRLSLVGLLALTTLVPTANAQGYSAANIPDGAMQRLGELSNAGQSLKSIAFTPGGGWAILYGNSGYWYANIPDGAAQRLGDLANAGQSLKSIAFAPNGGWAILYGSNGYAWGGIPDAAAQRLGELSNAGQSLKSIAFTPNGGWAILYGNNGYWWANIPDAAGQRLGELSNAGQSLKSIAFTTDGGWAILYGNNGYAWGGIPDGAAQKLGELANAGQSLKSISFAPGGGWAILQESGGGTTSTPGGPTADTLKALADQVFVLVNQARAQAGLAPYTRAAELDAAARRHSQDMATTGNLDHTGTDGSTYVQRITAAGYPGNPTGENIVAGFDTAEGAMNWWMNSAPHRASILSPNSNQIGISVAYQAGSQYGYYWTQVFGVR